MTAPVRFASHLLVLLILLVGLLACRGPESGGVVVSPTDLAPAPTLPSVEAATITPAAATPVAATPSPAAETPTPIYAGPLSAPCGVLLPPLPLSAPAGVNTTAVSDAARAALLAQAPLAARPALQRLLDTPGTVGLVSFQAGRETEGVYLNPDTPMPLASVAKVITLVAYAEALAAGELNPQEPIPLAELDRYYLPNFDLGAHRRAVAELRISGDLLSPDSDPAATLDDVAWMMIRHSSNAAADYLHLRLGQERIEQTAIGLGLNNPPGGHTAPCVFLGQFLMMANHSRGSGNDRAILAGYADSGPAGAAAYGREASLLADAYIGQETFRLAEQAWRSRTRQPGIEAQRYFAARLAPQGTAGAYAALMLRLAQNGLSTADSSFHARRILEWPNQFPANQELFSNVGYKNGSLPGVLTTAYYAYRWGDVAPVVVVLFYRDLPQQTYREWRSALPHDELARWLLADPAAIPALAAALREAS